LRTALAVLQRPHFPNRGWHMPVRLEDPRQQQVVDNLAEIKADYDAMRMTDALRASTPPTDNPSVSAGASPSATPAARNAPCPCGSGLKHKRCCGAASPGNRNPPNSAQRAAA
jgi:hypothetical protein